MKSKKIIPLLLIIIITMTALIRDLYTDTTAVNDKITFTQAQSLNHGWMYKDQRLTLPIKLKTLENTETIIYRYLPQKLNNNKYLCIVSSQQSIKVFLDKHMIYTYGYDEEGKPKSLPGNLYNIIKLPKDAAGKKITISYMSESPNQSGEINAILYGYKGDILLSILKNGIYELITFMALSIIAIICLLISFINRKKLKSNALFYNSLFLLTIALWVFLQSSLSQFVFISQHNVKIISYFCTMAAPIYANNFLRCMMKNDYTNVCRYFSKAYLINILINALVIIISSNLLNHSLLITHIMICINIAILIYILLHNIYKLNNNEDKLLTICVMPFLIASLWCILTCYTNDFVFTISRSLIIGIALSIIFISIVFIIYLLKLYKDAMCTKTLNTLAFQDTITGGKNRTAFYKDIESTLKADSANKSICVMILDLNSLKKINDTYGHLIGDEAIKTCYDCISMCIPKCGTCYRIGGDEFACIFLDCSEETIKDFIDEFSKMVTYYNKMLKYDFSAAYGYSFYNKDIDTSLLDTFNRADKCMYDKKQDMKNNNK